MTKKDCNEIDIYYIGYVTVKKIAVILTVNSLYLIINQIIGYFEEKNKNKFLFLDDVEKTKKFPKNMKKFGKLLKKKLKLLMAAKKLNMWMILKKLGSSQ